MLLALMELVNKTSNPSYTHLNVVWEVCMYICMNTIMNMLPNKPLSLLTVKKSAQVNALLSCHSQKLPEWLQ